jgi:hypothetical protein
LLYCLLLLFNVSQEWFMLLLLYCLQLLLKDWKMSDSCYCWLYCLLFLLKVWQRSGSCCYIVYHYCLRFDRGVVHVVVLILSTITVLGLTEEWFMLLMLYCLPLLIKVCQMSGSCCCFYIIYYCCLRFGRREFHVVVVIFSTIAL